MDQRRRTTVNSRSSVESAQMTSKPGSDVAPGLAGSKPAYASSGVRHRGSVSVIRALMLNCGNLRRRCEGKGTSLKGEADSTDAPPRGGATRSSVEAAVMVVERRGRIIRSGGWVNHVPRTTYHVRRIRAAIRHWIGEIGRHVSFRCDLERLGWSPYLRGSVTGGETVWRICRCASAPFY
jgi:hypothetical protein